MTVPDFEDKERGKAIPYGVYDLADNSGWGSLGVPHDTAQFAVGSSWVSGCWIWCQATRAPRRALPLLRVLWMN